MHVVAVVSNVSVLKGVILRFEFRGLLQGRHKGSAHYVRTRYRQG